MGIAETWLKVLQEAELARNYDKSPALKGTRRAWNPVVERLLPSLLVIEATSVLDDALEDQIVTRAISMPAKYRNTFGGRARYFADNHLFADPDDVEKLRLLRNKLGHEAGRGVYWSDLDAALTTVHQELQHFGYVGARPEYEYYSKRYKVRRSEDENFKKAQDFEIGLNEDGRFASSIGWTIYFSPREYDDSAELDDLGMMLDMVERLKDPPKGADGPD
jgi:hypothetical protein